MDKTSVTVDQYVRFREDGFLIVRGLFAPDEVRELIDHVDELVAERSELLRVHMLHGESELHERYLLHPRIVDVVAGLVGPDVLALQTMLFVKVPGSPGQGYHQNSFHIITVPDTLIGAWVALDRADEENGCVWMTSGSQNEPVYPDADEARGHGGTFELADIHAVSGADDPDESANDLAEVAAKYPGREQPAVLEPGDAVFFGGHVLHRSHENRSATRSRRAFVGHYCNARSHVPWSLTTDRICSPAAPPTCPTRSPSSFSRCDSAEKPCRRRSGAPRRARGPREPRAGGWTSHRRRLPAR